MVRMRKEYEGLPEKKKKFFDVESLHNPYADSRVLFGDVNMEVKKIIGGIDGSTGEILVADQLRQRGNKVDLVIVHHPSGHAYAALHEVMGVQADIYAEVGVPINVGHALISERALFIQRRIDPANHNQTVDAAKVLGMPFMSMHTFWDNITDDFIKKYLGTKVFETLGEIMDYLLEIPEFIESTKGKAGPFIASGNLGSKPGKIFISMTGGTNPSKEMYLELAKAGVGTIIDMHMPEDAREALAKEHVNIITTGHMASDSIGANLFFDTLEEKGVEVIPFGGLIRVKRNNR